MASGQRRIPLENALGESLAWFVRLRWLAAVGIAASAWALGGPLDGALPATEPAALYLIAAAVAAYNVFFALRLERLAVAARRFIALQAGLDWVALGFLVHYTGGLGGPAPLAFSFHILLGALLLSRRACYAQAACASALAAILAWVGGRPEDIWGQDRWAVWALLTAFWWGLAFITASLTARLRRGELAALGSERALAGAYADLKELHEERTFLSRVTHHQLRAPLAAADGLLQALSRLGPLDGRQEDLVARLRRRLAEARTTVDDLMDLAAAQRPRRGEGAPVDLSVCLRDSVAALGENAEAKGVQLEAQLPDDGVAVRGDADDLRRVCANLVENAVKYTPDGGRVDAVLRRAGDQVLLEVKDTGIGIASDERRRVFEDFYRSPAAKATGEGGSGLGLAIVERLVRRWDGDLALESEVGVGTLVRVRLPALA